MIDAWIVFALTPHGEDLEKVIVELDRETVEARMTETYNKYGSYGVKWGLPRRCNIEISPLAASDK